MAFGTTIRGDGRKLRRLGDRGREIAAQAARMAAVELERQWKDVLRGPGTPTKLGNRSGTLGRSVRSRRQTATSYRVGTPVVYARIHEFGGTIVPKRAPYLHFKVKGGGWVRTKKVTMPKRPHRKPAVERTVKVLDRELARLRIL